MLRLNLLYYLFIYIITLFSSRGKMKNHFSKKKTTKTKVAKFVSLSRVHKLS
jgi:hypothetical protein